MHMERSLVLAELERLTTEELVQCRRSANYRGISLLDQLENQLLYESA